MHEIECHKADALKLVILCRHIRLPTATTGTSINMCIVSWLTKYTITKMAIKFTQRGYFIAAH